MAASSPLATVLGNYYEFAGYVESADPLIAKCVGIGIVHDAGNHYMWHLQVKHFSNVAPTFQQVSELPPSGGGGEAAGGGQQKKKRRARQGSICRSLDQTPTFILQVGVSSKGLGAHRAKGVKQDHQDRHEEAMMPVDAARWQQALRKLGCHGVQVRKLNKRGAKLPPDESKAHSDAGVDVWTLAFGRPHFRFDGTCENPTELEWHHSDYQKREHLHTWELEFHPHKVCGKTGHWTCTATVGASSRSAATCKQDLHVNKRFELKQEVATQWEEDLEEWGCAIIPGHVHNYCGDGEEVAMSQRLHHKLKFHHQSSVVAGDSPLTDKVMRHAEEMRAVRAKEEEGDGGDDDDDDEEIPLAAEQKRTLSFITPEGHRTAVGVLQHGESDEFPMWREYGEHLHSESMRDQPDEKVLREQGEKVFGKKGRGRTKDISESESADFQDGDRGGNCNFFGKTSSGGSGRRHHTRSFWQALSDWRNG